MVAVHAKRCLFDCMFHGQIHTLDFGTPGFFIFIYLSDMPKLFDSILIEYSISKSEANYMIFRTELTFDLILRLRSIFRLSIHPYVFCQI